MIEESPKASSTEVILRVEDSAILFSTNSSEHPQNAKRTKNTT